MVATNILVNMEQDTFIHWQNIELNVKIYFQVWHELRNILMVMILLMLYLVLWVPYIVMAKGDQVAILCILIFDYSVAKLRYS